MRRASRLILSWIETWQFAVAGVSALFVASIVVCTAQDLSEVSVAKAEVEVEIARVLADDHAHLAVEHLRADPDEAAADDVIETAGYTSLVRQRVVDERSMLEIDVVTPGAQRQRFSCEVLPGPPPLALRRDLVVGGDVVRLEDGGARKVERSPSSAIDRSLAMGVRYDPSMAKSDEQRGAVSRDSFVRDDSIALMRLAAGTDQPDFSLAVDADGVAKPWFGVDRILTLDGNLWVPASGKPLTIEIERSATLVVRGNCYFERSIRVVSARSDPCAKLVILIEPQPDVAWSEGSGRLICGSPRRSEGARTDAELEPLSINANVVARVGATLHRSVVSEAAMVIGGDLILDSAVRLESRGTWRWRLGARDAAPGLVTAGPARPGALRRGGVDL